MLKTAVMISLHARKEWEELKNPSVHFTVHTTTFMLGSRPFSERPQLCHSVDCLAGVPAHCTVVADRKRRSPCTWFCQWSWWHSHRVSESAGICSIQSLVVQTQEIIKWLSNFPLSVLGWGIWNRLILGILEYRAVREPSIALYSKSWILLSVCKKVGNPFWSHPDYCGCATFWSCDFRQFTQSLKKESRSCCFVLGSVPCAGNKIKMKDKTRWRICPHKV